MNKRGGQIGILGVLLLVSILIAAKPVSSFGISTPYLENDTLKLEPGQSYVYSVNVQNGDDWGFYVDFNYSCEGNVASLRQRDNYIENKSYNNEYVFDIQVPASAIPGEGYRLEFWARPVINQTGQVPMTIEIKRFLVIDVVDSNGQGYRAGFADTFKSILKSAASLNNYVTPILLIAAVIACVILWRRSKMLVQKIAPQNAVAKFPISDAKSLEEVTYLLEILPDEQFRVKGIRNLFSAKLLELGERFLSDKVLQIGSKRKMLGIIK